MSERRETSPAVFVFTASLAPRVWPLHRACSRLPSLSAYESNAELNSSPKVQPMPGKKEIVDSIAATGKRLGRAPSQAEFISLSGISSYYVLQYFRSWNDAVRTARLRPYSLNIRPEDRALMEDWGKAARRHHRAPPRHAYTREGKYNPATIEKRFGPWSRLPEAFRNFAKDKPQWADVLALLPPPAARGPVPKTNRHQRHPIDNSPSEVPPREVCRTRLKGRATYGNPTNFLGLRYEPVNEQGVVLLFGMLAKELGYIVEVVQKKFPDCEAMRLVGHERWQRVLIEFEFESRNFRDHGHPLTGCDIIVCWRHNWPACPPHLEVVELSGFVKSDAHSREDKQHVSI